MCLLVIYLYLNTDGLPMKQLQQPPSQAPASLPVSSSVMDHFLTVKVEDGYEAINFEAMMAEVHGC